MQMSRKVYSLTDFLEWQRSGTLRLSPSFQRRPVWPPVAKSLLVDSVTRDMPLPVIFLREGETDLGTRQKIREIVDGQQRIRTLISFVEPGALKDYRPERDAFVVSASHNKELAGKKFEDLDPAVQQAILDYEFVVHVFGSAVKDAEILRVFSRLNSTGLKLNAQELRNAEWIGEFKQCAYAIASNELHHWREWRVFNENEIARMLEVEFTSDLINFMLRGVKARTKGVIDKLYKEFDGQFSESAEVERRFAATMETIDQKFSESLAASGKARSLTYALFAAVYTELYGLRRSLVETARAVPLTQTKVDAIAARIGSIVDEKAPQQVLESTGGRRTTDLDSRLNVYNHLLGKPLVAKG